MLTTTQAAAILGVDPSHVRRLILAGKLPSMKINARIQLLKREDVEAYKAAHPRSKAGRPKRS